MVEEMLQKLERVKKNHMNVRKLKKNIERQKERKKGPTYLICLIYLGWNTSSGKSVESDLEVLEHKNSSFVAITSMN